ncbi:MAG TPA: DUF4136 domain-containing protein [Candidatus Binatus sp.]|jgi:hypothetical protein|nr:DUF4136 domain-containing protein [Candidatus Binatus sp.]
MRIQNYIEQKGGVKDMRLFLRITLALFVLFVVASGAQAQRVAVDYDHHANFSQYKTFMWIRPPQFHGDPLMSQRIMDDVNAQLTAKGLQLVTENADLGVSTHVATREQHTLETFYGGFGGGWGWHYWGPVGGEAFTTEHTYEVGTLVADLFDAHTKQLIWRGEATDTLAEKPDKDTKKLNKAVEKLFKDFPPR